MLEQFKRAYAAHSWLRLIVCICLLGSAVLLFWVSGGFPPAAWRFLPQVIPQVPRLWERQGPSILLPLTGLAVQSVTLLISWGVLLWSGVLAVRHWRQNRRELRQFKLDMREAERRTVSQVQHATAESQKQPATVVGADLLRPPPGRPVSAPFSPPPSTVVGADLARPTPVNHTASPPAGFWQIEEDTQPLPRLPSSSPAVAVIEPPDEGFLLDQKPKTTRKTASTSPSPDSIYLAVGTGLDPGIKRKNRPNEDNLVAIQSIQTYNGGARPFGLFVVADGMGGHSNGQEASRQATQIISDTVVSGLLQHSADDDDEILRDLLADGIKSANLRLYQSNQEQQTDMGTTVTAALVIGLTAYVANVGDSRTYLYHEGEGLAQVTQDHSVVSDLVRAGAIAPADVYTHPRRNEIYRCLGEKPEPEVDWFSIQLQAGDILLLCSDGLWEMVRDSDIEEILDTSLPYPPETSNALIQAAIKGGGADNVSVIVAYVLGSGV